MIAVSTLSSSKQMHNKNNSRNKKRIRKHSISSINVIASLALSPITSVNLEVTQVHKVMKTADGTAGETTVDNYRQEIQKSLLASLVISLLPNSSTFSLISRI